MAQPDPILTAWVCQTTGLSPTHPAVPQLAGMLRAVLVNVWAAMEHGHGDIQIPVKQGRIVRVERVTTDYHPLDAT
jgi:hypothetical protein